MGGAKSMFSQEGSPASLSPSQEEERERRTTATSGKRCIGQSRKSTPLGSLVRMLLESQRWWSPVKRLTWVTRPIYSRRETYTELKAGSPLTESAKTSRTQDTKSSRSLYQLAVSEHPTEETGSGLLPTVQTQGLKRCSKEGKTEFYPTELLPTPSARDYKGNTITTTRRRKGQFTRWGEMLPDFITRLNEEQTGDSKASPQLNPLFVEEMMGFPFGWTTYPFLSESGDRKA